MEKMTKKIMIIVFTFLIITAAPLAAGADEQKPPADMVTGEVALSALSAYIWRGQELSRGSVVLQPSATISYKGFSFNAWGNLDTRPYSATGKDYSGNYTETDLTLSYVRKLGIVQLGGGYIYYALNAPSAGAADPLDSQEIFLTVGLDTLLAPTLTVYKEIDHYHQWYFLLGISHTFALQERVGLKLAATASYLKSEDSGTYPKYDDNAAATAGKYNNFHDATFSLSVPVNLTKSLTITPIVSYVFPLVDDAKNEMKGRGLKGVSSPTDRDDYYLYGGVTISFAF